MVCMDNSEWMRNGDYLRTRFDAQYQAIEYILRSKTSNVENTVGLLSLAGGANVGVQVLCSPTTEKFKVGRAAASAKIGGKADLATGLRVAQLALKYRANRQVQARIVVFIGSPIDAEEKKLVKIAKQLKKSNIAVDIVSMGELELNEAKLNSFMKEVDKKDTNAPCTLVIVPPGAYPEDVIQNSAMDSGVQEEDDPLLHMALQASLAESREAAGQPPIPPQAAAPSSSAQDDEEDMDEEERAMLEQAKLMSMMQEEPKSSKDTADASSLLDSNLLSDMLEKAGADPNDPDIKKALEEVNKKDKKDEEDDKK
eukprot:CAMPEP_0184027998 /NCGR_PEP_ID=MMETSP0954-20121128/14543_1 /TAXON_ID=627963 /ORGANISM="Aplanochytrium sp, Strain PBS07" /LENGTH=311 /DNA_ID=CAMNT_0026312687 /DNA_START=219 /DNA_END=1154 /DNA_ORIENTATION=-